VLDPTPPRTAIRTAAGRARLSRLDPETAASRREADDAAIRQALDERGASGLALGELTSRLGLAPAAAREAWQRVVDAGHASPAGDRLVGARVIEDLGGRLLELLAGHHRDEPQSDGLPREEARERVFAKAPAAVFEFVLKALDGSGQVTGRDRLALTTHRVAYSADEQRALAAVETAYRDGGLTPPDPAGLAAAAGLSPAQVDQALRVLVRQKTLLKIENLVFHTLALAQLRHDLAALKAVAGPGATVDVASFKQRYGLSRKYAIPLLEYLDRERVTRRVGERRVLL
jgi:selenocysteine-specific elongation factor